MRWSWPAFATGTALGAAACLLLLRSCGETVAPAPAPDVARAPRPRSDAPREEEPSSVAPAASSPPGRIAGGEPADAPAPKEAPSPRRPRARAEETAPPAPEPQGAGHPGFLYGGGGTALREFRAVRIDGTLRTGITLVNGRLFLSDITDASSSLATTQSLARAKQAARDAAARGDEASPRRIDELLASAADADRELAMGMALAASPPMTDVLARVAREAKYGSLRATALAALAEAAPDDPATADAVIALVSDPHADVSRAAADRLGLIGLRGADKAASMLRSGDFASHLLPSLVTALAASPRAVDFLLARPEPSVAMALLAAMPRSDEGGPPPAWHERLADILRPLLAAPEFEPQAAAMFQVAAKAGHESFLRTVATSAGIPAAVREAAVNALLADAALRPRSGAVVGLVIADARSPDSLVCAVVTGLAPDVASEPSVRAALADVAASHTNRWIREFARQKLQLAAPVERGELVIESAYYGVEGRIVDVTRELASRVTGGRLTTRAGNELYGDPAPGVAKSLTVTYVWNGERRTRTVGEGETLTLP